MKVFLKNGVSPHHCRVRGVNIDGSTNNKTANYASMIYQRLFQYKTSLQETNSNMFGEVERPDGLYKFDCNFYVGLQIILNIFQIQWLNNKLI